MAMEIGFSRDWTLEGCPRIKVWSMGLTISHAPNRKRYTSRWWSDLAKASLLDQGDNWSNPNMVWKVGSRRRSNFGKMSGQLKIRYERIYNNSELKDKSIGSFGSWTTEGWEWKFSWRRDWFEWEKSMVEDFMAIISQVPLQLDKEDLRIWNDPPRHTHSQ